MQNNIEYEILTPPTDDGLIAAARSNRGGWVYDLDYEYAAKDYVPPEAIRGAWEVSDSGELTGRYKRNERYRAITTCERPLKPYVHAGARHCPGEWISEIDPRGEHLFPKIPDELILGWWLVGSDGSVTNSFRPNSLYQPAADSVNGNNDPKIAAKVPLDTKIETGKVCPTTGMWVPATGTKALLLRAGENVPTAQVSKKLTLMQKMKGELDFEYVPTVWTLREYKDK